MYMSHDNGIQRQPANITEVKQHNIRRRKEGIETTMFGNRIRKEDRESLERQK
jgi:hypothetical protein